MNKMSLLFLTAISLNAVAESRFVDLSHEFSKSTLTWPGSKSFKVSDIYSESKDGFYVAARGFSSHEHTGTHVDAPCHFAKGLPCVSELPLAQLMGAAVKIDLSEKTQSNRDYQITVDDLKRWEKTHGKIQNHSIVLLSTGYAKHWSNLTLYSGTTKRGEAAASDLHFPGLSLEAAEWLVNSRQINAIGIDTFSIDYGQGHAFKTHQFLTKHQIPIFENVADMTALPVNHFKIIALPMKIQGGTGAPVRILVELGDKNQ